ncbi:hypothetical protein [Phaeovulum sp.]|uniref:hypothetical protein n=1 Tax=Phaeovulum sp. TaxID=2934796 RepID=UPI002734B002|nr:hypothetical protein [Phaeovulum sp.]
MLDATPKVYVRYMMYGLFPGSAQHFPALMFSATGCGFFALSGAVRLSLRDGEHGIGAVIGKLPGRARQGSENCRAPAI